MDASWHQIDGVSVHAGFPNPAADRVIDNLNLPELLIPRPLSTFLFRISGSSSEGRGIYNGDIAVIDRSLKPHRSDLVVWWQDDSFILSPLSAVACETVIWGVITSIIHTYRKQ